MGVPTLLEFLKIPEIDKVKVLLQPKYKRNKLVKRIVRKNPGKIEFYYGDVSNIEDVRKVLEGSSYCFNLAGVIPPLSDKHPELSYLANEVGPKNIVKVIEEHKEIKLIDITSVAVYCNRDEKHPFIRVGDPLIPSAYDLYATHKVRSEFAILESDVPYFVIIRQTAMIYRDMLTSNMNDGIIFHTSFNSPLEWSTDEETAILLANIIREDLAGNLTQDNFWRKVFNLGAKEENRISGYDTINNGFKLFGGEAKDFYDPNYNVIRNFHGGFYYDGDRIEKLLHYQKDYLDDYWLRIKKDHPELGFARIMPKKWIKSLSIKRLFKDENSPAYWYKHNDMARITAYFGSMEKYEKLPQKWDEFPIFDYKAIRSNSFYKPIDYGFDIDKEDREITITDLANVAKKHGGKLLSKEFKTGDVYAKLEWENSDGEKFIARPYTILRAGHWYNPIYKEYVWDFDRLSKKDELYATFWYDTHDKDEDHCYYMNEKYEAKLR